MTTKNEQIKATLAETRLKRQTQVCKVFELKIDESRLNKVQREALKMMFIEGKWCWNHLLNQANIFDYDYKLLEKVQARDKNGKPVEHEIKHLTAKNRQNILYQMHSAIRSLGAIKRKTKKRVGRLRFKSEYNTIELSQYGITHKITGKNTVKINGIKKHIKVRGLDQITTSMEIANAKLCKRASGYFIVLTTYQSKSLSGLNNKPKSNVGLDFGISRNIMTSDGKVYNVSIPEDEQLKRLQRQLHRRSQKGSKNRYKLRLKIRKHYEHISNQKKDKANKIIHELLTMYAKVYFQDENLRGWHSGKFGRQVQRSCLGVVKRKLKEQIHRTWMLDRFFPSTQLCYQCLQMNEMPLEKRVYTCKCGLTEDRDLKAAKTILYIGMQKEGNLFVPTERRDIKPAESPVSTNQTSVSKLDSVKQEAPHFSEG